MSVNVIRNPLPGERVLDLSPPDAAAAAVTWRRRPNLFPGRTLTAPTLEARSQWSTGRIATRGQAFTAGVLRGLQVGHTASASDADGGRPRVRLHVASGHGLAQSGEDVVLTRAMDADFWSLPVVAPPGLLAGEDGMATDALQPRVIGPALGELRDELPEGMLPSVGVLVLQPVSVNRADIDPDDPCDRCACDGNISFEDWRLADAARLLWYAWPLDWSPLAPLPPDDARRRNRLAWQVFGAERALPPGELMPWEAFGVPLAVVGVTGEFLPDFVDHASVVRRGGRSRHEVLRLAGSALDTSVRLPPLWQAQIEQLAEHLAAIGDVSPAQLAAQFDRLPPFGLLPRDAVDIAARRSPLFPGGFDLDAVPAPIEQLDLAVRETAGLAPLDFARGERVRLLVPVSQAAWEPRLLLTEVIDPEFAATLARFLLVRADRLARRQYLRLRGATLLTALRGSAPPVPPIGEDAQALEPESLQGWGPPPASGGHRSTLSRGLHESGFDGASTPLAIARTPLYVWTYLDPAHPPRTLLLEFRSGDTVRRAYWGENLIDRGEDGTPTRMRIGDLPEHGRWLRLELDPAVLLQSGETTLNATGMGFVLYGGQAAFAGVGRIATGGEEPWFSDALPPEATAAPNAPMTFFGAGALLAPFEPDYGVIPVVDANGQPAHRDSRALRELAVAPALTQLLSPLEQAQLRQRGVDGFIAYLKSRADRADDLVDYGFVKVQTDIYRIRQLMLGNTKASRLAVSPTLANIAQAETAVASHERISEFFKDLQDAPQPVRLSRSGASASNNSARANMVMADTFDISSDSLTTASKVPFGGLVLADAVFTPKKTIDFAGLNLIAPKSFQANYIPSDISNATPIVGKVNLRTMRIAQRLALPETQEARDYSTSTRHDGVQALVRLANELIREDGGAVGEEEDLPGLFQDTNVWGLEGEPFVANVPAGEPKRLALSAFIADKALLIQLLSPPVRNAGDEASLFSDSADLSDRTVALFRQLEARIRLYRDLIDRCETARDALQTDLKALGDRERATAGELAEARHDVAVARALIDEEQARLDAINAHRAEVLEREVRFVAYMRPRAADNLAEAPSRVLDPGLLEAPAPACLQSHADVPDELSAMLAMVREAPAAWFKRGPDLFRPLDRIDLLVQTVKTAQRRLPTLQLKTFALQTGTVSSKSNSASIAATGLVSALASSITQVQVAQHTRITHARSPLLQLDIASLGRLSWQGVFDRAVQVLSLGDLIDGEHGQGRVVRNAAAMFERFGHVCGCLHAGFSDVLPSIRLDWAEALSQFDDAPNLRSLAVLARWAELDYTQQRRLQGLVDWLFDQIQSSTPQAHELVSDVVRICLLLASHAPVGRIIAGRLPRPVTARPGLRIALAALEPSRLRIGMQALMYRGDRIVARALVENIDADQATARVVHTQQASVDLDETVRVQFSEAASIDFAAAMPLLKVF